jgi:fucose 4-O-acetylase-like acetyltransferase
MKKRLSEIDIVRGITILLVVAGHTEIPIWLNDIFRNFRMPLFFLVSGYLFSSKKYINNLTGLFISRFWSILVPYFSAGLLFYLLWIIYCIYKKFEYGFIWFKPLVGIFYGNGIDNWLGMNTPLWFLVCLFSTQILFGLIYKKIQNFSFLSQMLIFFIIGLIGVKVSKVLFLPWGIDIALVSVLFLFIGNKFKMCNFLQSIKFTNWCLLLSVTVFFITSLLNSTVDMNNRLYGNIFLFYTSGISGSIFILLLSKLASRFNVLVQLLSLIGRESLLILIFHFGFCFILLNFINERLFNNSINWTVYLILGILLPMIFGNIIKRVTILNILFNGKKEHSNLKVKVR